jgi:hypothetical protein
MSALEQPLADFFLSMQRSMAIADALALTRMFAPHMLEASPSETRMRTNDAVFLEAVEERFSYLLLAGLRDVKALQIDPTPLGADYALVRVRWSMWFTPPGRPDFVDEFVFDYFVHLGERIEIAAAIAHDDDASILRRIGLA